MAYVKPTTDRIVAHLPGVKAAVWIMAEDGAANARAKLAAHRYRGDAQIEVSLGKKTDAYVTLSDMRGQRAALSIEFGHGPYTSADGRKIGPSQGLAVVRGAFT